MLSETPALNGWHPGERAVQDLMGLPQLVPSTAVVKALPNQHRLFYSTRLHFLPVTTLDKHGRPWASILTASDGNVGFITSPDETKLVINAHLIPQDPILQNLPETFGCAAQVLISGVGVETTTRRRNKFAGFVENFVVREDSLRLGVYVNEALGQCPKYINARSVVPHNITRSQVLHSRRVMQSKDRLPDSVIAFIHGADTAYLATSYQASPKEAKRHPSHVGTSHRAGRPGFIRVRPSDGRTLVLPNYSGNRLLNSLGNIQITPLAGLVFPRFNNGSVLYITGDAITLFGEDSQRVMPGCNVLTTIISTGYVLVEDALPLRHAPGTKMEQSPYGPPILYLAEERPPALADEEMSLHLISSTVHCPTLATFTFEASRPVTIQPPQSGVFELSNLVRNQARKLIDWTDDSRRENDDCVRTWTISIPSNEEHPRTFSITIRENPKGLVTSTLFKLSRKVLQGKQSGYADLRSLDITLKLRDVNSDHYSLEPVSAYNGGQRLLWAGGGIGITPFLSLADRVARHVQKSCGLWDIVLVVSTREPDVMLELIRKALSPLGEVAHLEGLTFAIHFFSHITATLTHLPEWITVHQHRGRVQDSPGFFKTVKAAQRDCHICGPLPFIQSVMAGLEEAGADPEAVRRERFTY